MGFMLTKKCLKSLLKHRALKAMLFYLVTSNCNTIQHRLRRTLVLVVTLFTIHLFR